MLLLGVLLCAAVAQAQILQVTTNDGVVIGQQVTDPEGNYVSFLGIPYGRLNETDRFQAALPPVERTGPFTANVTVRCAQPSATGIVGVEDCLTVSIFTKNVTTPKPVLVWLNAEDYATSPEVLPNFSTFVNQEIVVVALNFRLSLFGFLCLGVAEAPGNAGVKDIIQGLVWINLNIAAFGGNPSNVMLMGHGSAAALVDIVTMVPRAFPFVHKAVTLSGSVLAPWAVSYTPRDNALTLYRALGYNPQGKSYTELAQELRALPLQRFNTTFQLTKFTNNTVLFAPCIEDRRVVPVEAILTEPPINMLRNGNYSHIPYITSFVSQEGTIRAEEAITGLWIGLMSTDFARFIPIDINYESNRTGFISSIRDTYFPNTINLQNYLLYQGDVYVVTSVVRGARERAATSVTDVRLMSFDYTGTYNSDWQFTGTTLTGTKHGGIMNYLFNEDLTVNDTIAKNSVISRFTSFAHTGVPTANVNDVFNQTWPALSNTNLVYLRDYGYSRNATYLLQPAYGAPFENMYFWDYFYDNHYLPPRSVSASSRLGAFLYSVLFSFLLAKFVF